MKKNKRKKRREKKDPREMLKPLLEAIFVASVFVFMGWLVVRFVTNHPEVPAP